MSNGRHGWAGVASWGVAALLFGLMGCSATSDKAKPAELGPSPDLVGARQAWTAKIGSVDFALDVPVQSDGVVVASSDGTLQKLDVRNGSSVWRTAVAGGISAGVGSDGHWNAVVTRGNELVILDRDREAWRTGLTAQVFTAPLVAGERIFLLSADRSVTAYDARTGRRLWTQSGGGEALVLRQAGVLLPVGDTLVVGRAGRVLGLDPANGQTRWEVVVGNSRGTNDVERLIDVVGRAARDRGTLCVRSFQSAVACLDANRGTLLWTRLAMGATGLGLDDSQVYGTDLDGKVIAWRRSNGERVWSNDKLLRRVLTAPLTLGRTLVVGDDAGQLHWLARSDGQLQHRVSIDGSPIAVTPVMADGALIAITRSGSVSAFMPE